MRSRAVIVAAALSGALVTGGWLMQAGLARSASGRANGARLYDEVVAHVERQYVDTVSDSALYRRSLDGMLRELHDPHTVFLTPSRLAKLNESTTGRYAGVGIQIDIRGGWITVVTPLPGTPAQAAGIRTGDRIVQIEGKPTEGWTAEEAQNTLRGAPGSVVHVVAERPGVEAKLPFTLTRREIHFDPVQHAMMLHDGIGYVALTVFGEGSDVELRHAIDSLRGAGLRSLILDLRGNPGGLLEQGVGVADLFLNPGQEIVRMRGRTSDANRDYVDRAAQAWPDLKLAALVDSGSASASEIVAGALQDHDRAVLVGTTTYGKGSAQSLFTMPNGGALKLTTALWFTPAGRSINKTHPADDVDDGDGAGPPSDTASSQQKRPGYRTDSGRVVFGGGGITPDVVVTAPAESDAGKALERALGKEIPAFRGVLTDYALALKARGSISNPSFTVSPDMRAELYSRLQQHGVSVPRTTYDSAAALVDRLLGYQIAQYVFGPNAAVARQTADDPFIGAAVKALDGESRKSGTGSAPRRAP